MATNLKMIESGHIYWDIFVLFSAGGGGGGG